MDVDLLVVLIQIGQQPMNGLCLESNNLCHPLRCSSRGLTTRLFMA